MMVISTTGLENGENNNIRCYRSYFCDFNLQFR